MPRIGGDTEDLPAGWTVDKDNWGTRPARSTDEQFITRNRINSACVENGKLFVMDAATARRMS